MRLWENTLDAIVRLFGYSRGVADSASMYVPAQRTGNIQGIEAVELLRHTFRQAIQPARY